ncbi:helix-turn-helix transcriptional regulator [Paracoccus litorisediminis]|uniref:helix-turn-helix transcriptional regulator n=1 Tax=Paracoccus litorisediminis TaxID=2006130 RepID=UPI003730DA46
MPKTRPLTSDEKFERRKVLRARAEAGDLQLPDAIKEIRQALGMTQAVFAEKFGLTRLQVIALEKGKANPTLETLAKIGRPFGFVPGFVYGGKKSGQA